MRHDFGDLAFPRVHTVEEVVAPQIFRRHVDELLDVDRGQHGFLAAIRTAVGAFDAHAFAALHDQARDRLVGENHAIVRLDEFRERLRQDARSALWNGPARADRGIGGAAGHRILRRRHARRRAHHERAAVVVLKIVAEDFPLRHGQAALPYFALGMFGQALGDGFSGKTGRRQTISLEDGSYRLIFVMHAPVGRRIFLGKLSKFLASAVEIAPLRDVAAVGEGHVVNRIRLDVLDPVIANQVELIVAHDRVGLNAAMRGRARIVFESGQRDLFRFHSAADLWAILQDENTIARLGQVSRRDQAVVPGAGNDDIEFIGRGRLRHQTEGRKRKWRERCRAFRESTPCHFGHKIFPPPLRVLLQRCRTKCQETSRGHYGTSVGVLVLHVKPECRQSHWILSPSFDVFLFDAGWPHVSGRTGFPSFTVPALGSASPAKWLAARRLATAATRIAICASPRT